MQAFIANEKDALPQLLNSIAFTFREHPQAMGGECAMRHHVSKSLRDQEYIVTLTGLKLL